MTPNKVLGVMKKYALKIAWASLLFLFMSPAQSTEYDSVDVHFEQPASSLSEIRKAIKLTLIDRNWILDGENETSMRATYRQDDSTWLTVTISYDVSHALIGYAAGPQVARLPGRKVTDSLSSGRYDNWVGNLAKDLPNNLKRLKVLFGP